MDASIAIQWRISHALASRDALREDSEVTLEVLELDAAIREGGIDRGEQLRRGAVLLGPFEGFLGLGGKIAREI